MFRTLSVLEARALLLYGIERRLPIQLVTARPGFGKSHLLSALARTCGEDADLVVVSRLPSSVDAIARELLGRLGVAARSGLAPLETLCHLGDVLAERRRQGRLAALLIDDAHDLPTSALLDLRLLAGQDLAGGALLPVVLAGSPVLATRLGDPDLEPLRCRVATHIELQRPIVTVDPDAGMPVRSPAPPTDRWAVYAVVTLALVGALLAASRWLPVSRDHDTRLEATAFQLPRLPSRTMTPPRVRHDTPASPGRGPVEPAEVRRVVDAFREAVARRDVETLEALLTPDARQNGVRGRTAIIATYAHRFSRIDAPAAIDPPTDIAIRDGVGHAVTPFATAYRDAAGDAGRASGTASWRIVRHHGRALIDAVDYRYGEPAQ